MVSPGGPRGRRSGAREGVRKLVASGVIEAVTPEMALEMIREDIRQLRLMLHLVAEEASRRGLRVEGKGAVLRLLKESQRRIQGAMKRAGGFRRVLEKINAKAGETPPPVSTVAVPTEDEVRRRRFQGLAGPGGA